MILFKFNFYIKLLDLISSYENIKMKILELKAFSWFYFV